MSFISKISPEDEKILIGRCKKGDLTAFSELIDSYQNKVFSLAFRLIGNEDDAEDISQEIFVKFFRTVNLFKGESSLATWLYRITVNEVKNFWKSKTMRNSLKTKSIDSLSDPEDENIAKVQFADPTPSPRDIASENELLSHLERLMKKISDEFREILILRFKENLSYEEIASILNINIGTVKSRLARARIELKSLMEPYL